jgi:hypothetical protein
VAAWVLEQRRRHPAPPPLDALRGVPLTGSQAEILVGGWELWPENPHLAGAGPLVQLADLLAPVHVVQGRVAVLLVRAGRLELAAACVRRWLQGPLRDEALATVAALLAARLTRRAGVMALRHALSCAAGRPGLLRRLCRLAFDHGCYDITVAAAGLLTTCEAPLDPDVVAMWIAALALQGHAALAARQYERRWRANPGAPSFPYPQHLLPALHHSGADALRAHLLRHIAPGELLPRWVQIERQDALGQHAQAAAAWEALLAEIARGGTAPQASPIGGQPAWLYSLLRLTECCLHHPPPPRRTRTAALRRWAILLKGRARTPAATQIRQTAACAIVLLLPADGARIRVYRALLERTPLGQSRWVRRAAAAYLEALARERRWADVARFTTRSDIAALRDVLSGDEHTGWLLLAMIEEQIAAHQPHAAYDHLWRRMVCLALSDTQVCALLERSSAAGRADGSDLALLLAWRGRECAERLIASLPDMARQRVERTRLDRIPSDHLAPLAAALRGLLAESRS